MPQQKASISSDSSSVTTKYPEYAACNGGCTKRALEDFRYRDRGLVTNIPESFLVFHALETPDSSLVSSPVYKRHDNNDKDGVKEMIDWNVESRFFASFSTSFPVHYPYKSNSLNFCTLFSQKKVL